MCDKTLTITPQNASLVSVYITRLETEPVNQRLVVHMPIQTAPAMAGDRVVVSGWYEQIKNGVHFVTSVTPLSEPALHWVLTMVKDGDE